MSEVLVLLAKWAPTAISAIAAGVSVWICIAVLRDLRRMKKLNREQEKRMGTLDFYVLPEKKNTST